LFLFLGWRGCHQQATPARKASRDAIPTRSHVFPRNTDALWTSFPRAIWKRPVTCRFGMWPATVYYHYTQHANRRREADSRVPPEGESYTGLEPCPNIPNYISTPGERIIDLLAAPRGMVTYVACNLNQIAFLNKLLQLLWYFSHNARFQQRHSEGVGSQHYDHYNCISMTFAVPGGVVTYASETRNNGAMSWGSSCAKTNIRHSALSHGCATQKVGLRFSNRSIQAKEPNPYRTFRQPCSSWRTILSTATTQARFIIVKGYAHG
jgi:hypothetical protein